MAVQKMVILACENWTKYKDARLPLKNVSAWVLRRDVNANIFGFGEKADGFLTAFPPNAASLHATKRHA